MFYERPEKLTRELDLKKINDLNESKNEMILLSCCS